MIVHTLFIYSLVFLFYCCRYYLSLLFASQSDGYRIIYVCTLSLLNFAVVIYVPINLGLHSFYHARIHFFSWNLFSMLQTVLYAYTCVFAFVIAFVLGGRHSNSNSNWYYYFFIVVGVDVCANFGPNPFQIHFCKRMMILWRGVCGRFCVSKCCFCEAILRKISTTCLGHQNHFQPFVRVDWWTVTFIIKIKTVWHGSNVVVYIRTLLTKELVLN